MFFWKSVSVSVGSTEGLKTINAAASGQTWDGAGFSNIGSNDIRIAAIGPGDANCDSNVNFADFLTLSGNFGETTGMKWTDGDFDGDGGVTFSDFLILSANYDGTPPPPPQ